MDFLQLQMFWCFTIFMIAFPSPQIVNRHGPEADRHLLRCLFSHVDFSGDGKSSGKDFHQVNSALEEMLAWGAGLFLQNLFCLPKGD